MMHWSHSLIIFSSFVPPLFFLCSSFVLPLFFLCSSFIPHMLQIDSNFVKICLCSTFHSLILEFVYAHRAGWNGQIGSVWLPWKIFVYAVLFWAKKGSEITLCTVDSYRPFFKPGTRLKKSVWLPEHTVIPHYWTICGIQNRGSKSYNKQTHVRNEDIHLWLSQGLKSGGAIQL